MPFRVADDFMAGPLTVKAIVLSVKELGTGAAVALGQKEVIWSQALSKRHIDPKRNNGLNSGIEMDQGKQSGIFTQTTNMPLPQLMSVDKYPKSLINLRRKNITKREMIQLLEVIWLPDELAIVH